MFDASSDFRCVTSRFASMTLVVGLASLIGAIFPMTSVNAAPSTSIQSTPPGTLRTTLPDPLATEDDFFGTSIAVSGDVAVVGAFGTDSFDGAAYIYMKGASGWPTTPNATLSGMFDFGMSVAISGKTVIVGAQGAAFIYVEGASGWPARATAMLVDPKLDPDDEFGDSVAVSGGTALVGAVGDYQNSGIGEAYIYDRSASGWPTTPTAMLTDPDTISDNEFSSSVALSGTTAVIGAPESDTAYVYVKGASNWPRTPTVTLGEPADGNFGYSVAVSGSTAAVSANGLAYIYVKGTYRWPTTPTATLQNPDTTGNEYFGGPVAVSKNIVAVGAGGGQNSTGSAYIYVRDASVWPTTPTAQLQDPESSAGDLFANCLAVSGALKRAFVCASEANSREGAAYIYKA